jgi:hypothetical protein
MSGGFVCCLASRFRRWWILHAACHVVDVGAGKG